MANSLRGIGTGAQPDLRPRLPSLAVATLLLAGADDPKYVDVNREMAQQIPNARLVVLPHAGHNVHLERPGAFSSSVLNFWQNCDDDRSQSP